VIVLTRLIELVDPAARYMRGDRPARGGRGPVFRGAAILTTGGGRQATPDELTAIRAASDARRAQHDAELDAARARWLRPAQRAAGELLATGTAVVPVPDGELTARLVRFWRGDHILDVHYHQRRDQGRSISRMPRRELDAERITARLQCSLARLDR
jgi:hypothetical protein